MFSLLYTMFYVVQFNLSKLRRYTHLIKDKRINIRCGFNILFSIAGTMAAIGIYANQHGVFPFVFFLQFSNVFK